MYSHYMRVKISLLKSHYGTIVFTIFVTVIIVRIFLALLFIAPIDSASIYTDKLHHYYLGLVILAICLAARRIPFRNILVGIGLGLIIDEFMLPFYIVGLWNYGYWSFIGMLPIFIILLIILIHYRYKRERRISAKKLN